MSGTLFFEVMDSNEPTATVEIRPVEAHLHHTWLYQITESHPPRIFRGTVNASTADPLDLIHLVLTDYQDQRVERAHIPGA